MFKNKFIKLLTAAAFAVVSIGVTSTISNSNTLTVQASTFHYLRKNHKLVTLGFGQKLPLRLYRNGKRIYADDSPTAELNYTDDSINTETILKTHGWKYINGVKYYKLYDYFNDASAYVPAKYFTKKYNDLSYLTVYNVNHKIKALADDMQNSDQGDWYGKGDIILVNNYSIWNHDKYVDTISPMQDGKHNADGAFAYSGMNIGGELKPDEFKKYCSKASANTKFYMNNDTYYTNASLARGGLYMNGKFYKIYNK
jgi:hypothetical protein